MRGFRFKGLSSKKERYGCVGALVFLGGRFEWDLDEPLCLRLGLGGPKGRAVCLCWLSFRAIGIEFMVPDDTFRVIGPEAQSGLRL